jgi:hypothetical protein
VAGKGQTCRRVLLLLLLLPLLLLVLLGSLLDLLWFLLDLRGFVAAGVGQQDRPSRPEVRLGFGANAGLESAREIPPESRQNAQGLLPVPTCSRMVCAAHCSIWRA